MAQVMKIVEHVTLKRCPSCEHIHSVNTECKWRTPATGSGFAPRCGCMIGAEPTTETMTIDEDDEGCQGHESLDGAHMGESVFCDGSCVA